MFSRIARWSVALAALASIACQAPSTYRLDHMNVSTLGKRTYGRPAPEPAKPAADSEREPFATIGDTISISAPVEREELTLEKHIDLDGTILLPELGAVAVAGYTRPELEALLRSRYAPCYGPIELKVVIVPAANARLDSTNAPARQQPTGPKSRDVIRAWLREWILFPQILIAGNEPSPGLWVAKGQRPRVP